MVQADLKPMTVLMLQNAELTGMRHHAHLIMLFLGITEENITDGQMKSEESLIMSRFR